MVDLDPTRGSEANKRRPAVIISNDAANAVSARVGHGVVTVVPVTSNVDNVRSFHVLLPADETGLRLESKAQAEQVRAVSVDRVGPLVGRLSPQLVARLDDALRLHLDL